MRVVMNSYNDFTCFKQLSSCKFYSNVFLSLKNDKIGY